MATTSTITGDVVLPSGEAFTSGVISFKLSATDTEGAQVFPGGGVKQFTLNGAAMPAGAVLWRNTAGLAGTHYVVTLDATITTTIGVGQSFSVRKSFPLRNVQVGSNATYTIGALMDTPVGDAQDWARQVRFFATRAAFVTWAAANTPAVGAVQEVEGLSYRYIGTGTAISDLAGWVPVGDVYPDHLATNTTPGTTDMSAAINAALVYSPVVKLKSATYICKNIVLNTNNSIIGAYQGLSVLKLPNSANTWLIAHSPWANNSPSSIKGGRLQDLRLDGNKANNATGSLGFFCAWSFECERVEFYESAAHGMEHTAVMQDGITYNTNGFSDCKYTHCRFTRNVGHGFYGHDSPAGRIADYTISSCEFNGNGGRLGADIYLERAVGAKINDCQLYTGGFHSIYLQKLSRSLIIGNNIDVRGSLAIAGDRPSGIWIQDFDVDGNSLITNNVLNINVNADSSGGAGILYKAMSMNTGGGTYSPGTIFGSNVIGDHTPALGAKPYYFGFSPTAASTGVTWYDDALDATMTANADQFPHSAWSPTARRSGPFQPPSMTTTVRDALLDVRPGQIIYNTSTATLQVFEFAAWSDVIASALTTPALASVTAAATVSIATGATISGSTKTVNIGTGGASGAVSNVIIGSGTTGVTGKVQIQADFFVKMLAPAGVAGAATLTVAQLQTTAINYSGAVAAVTFPDGTSLDTLFNTVNTAFEFSVMNTGSGAATMTANTGVTIVGAAAVANGTSARWAIRRTAASTYVAYRLT